MARYDIQLTGDPYELVAHLDAEILRGSVSASLEEQVEHRAGDARMIVRTYERYSGFSGSRVSLTFAILSVGQQLGVSAVSTGGSRAMFFKMDTVGEGSFLGKATAALDSFPQS
jgi:hypothetical protein